MSGWRMDVLAPLQHAHVSGTPGQFVRLVNHAQYTLSTAEA